MPPSNDVLLTLYRKMVLMRRFEEKAGQAYGQKKIQGFCHLYTGQEAVAAGCIEALRPDDYMLSGYRSHTHPLARGAHPGMLMAELFAKSSGYSKGKGGSMHLFDVEHHWYGGYGIVGGQIPLAAGMAFASKYRGEDRVTVCSFGEAASNQGSFHETLNMATKWKLPVIFVCENNKYGMGTEVSRVSAQPEIYKRAAGYAMRGETFDGMNAIDSYEMFKDTAEYCRKGKGPVLVEARTYRYRGHSMSDAATYRTKDEVEAVKSRQDPITVLGEHLTKKKLATPEQLVAIDEAQKKICEEAVAFADAAPETTLDELYTDMVIEPGDPDVHPRERVLGATDVKWPSYPSGSELKVTWELEPREQLLAPAPKKGAA